MKDFLSKDSVLKAISFIVAVLIWIYIIIVVDPLVDVTVRDIPVRYANRTMLTEQGLCVLDGGDNIVELKIKGSRKKIANIDNKNVYATVDLGSITRTGRYTLPVNISIPYEYSEILSKKPYSIEVNIDKLAREERNVEIIAEGEVAEGYIAGKPVSDISKVEVEGPASVLAEVKRVCATFDYEERAADIKETAEIHVLDANGKRIDDKIKLGTDKTEIQCPVYKLKTVPVTVDYGAEVNTDEYRITVQPSNLSVYASNELLAELSEIFTERVSFDELKENKSVICGIVVPEGVSLRDGITEITIKLAEKN